MPRKNLLKAGPYALTVSGTDSNPELYIYGDIGDNWWDDESTSAIDLVKALVHAVWPKAQRYWWMRCCHSKPCASGC